MKQIHFLVSGDVQGVCFRYYSSKKAQEKGLKGFVKNLSNGKVEVIIEGSENQINDFFEFCKNNPAYSHIQDVEIIGKKDIKEFSFDKFEVCY